jgi:hypothetical protein
MGSCPAGSVAEVGLWWWRQRVAATEDPDVKAHRQARHSIRGLAARLLAPYIPASRITSDPMTQSAEDSARAILRVFSSEDVRAGHVLMYAAVNVQFLKSCSAEDFAAGLAYAIEREWLSNENTMIRLTKSGFDESQKLK